MSAAPSWRSTNVAMYDAETVACRRCGLFRVASPRTPELCLSCSSVERAQANSKHKDVELTGGYWRADSRGIQRWVSTTSTVENRRDSARNDSNPHTRCERIASENPPARDSLNDMNTERCVDCDARLYSLHKWKLLTAEHKAQLRAKGWERCHGRGLCGVCYDRHTAAGSLIDYERNSRPIEEVIEDFEQLDLDRTIPLRRRCKLAAPHIGMDARALERALYRARSNGKWAA